MDVPKEILVEIANELSCKMRCFLHKSTFKLVGIPDELIFGDIDEEDWQEEIKAVQSHGQEYLEIEPMSSRDSFQIMEDFASQLSDNGARVKLLRALDGKKPFAHFNALIHQMPDYHKKAWFAFRDERILAFVEQQVRYGLC